MTDSNSPHSLSMFDVLSHSPELVRGLPKKVKGLYHVAKQKRNPVNSLASCLELAASKFPQHEAIVFEGQTLRYFELNEYANRMARYLSQTGSKRGDVHVVAMENRVELLVTVIALSKLGVVSALINTSQRNEVLKHSVSLVKPTRVIVGSELYDAFCDIREVLPKSANEKLWVQDVSTTNRHRQTKAPSGWVNLFLELKMIKDGSNFGISDELRANDPLCYFYTSGTTGLPKAAVLTNGRYMKAYGGIGEACLQLNQTDRVYVPLPFYHATALVVAWSSILAGGACLVLARKFSSSAYWEDVIAQRVTALCYIGELCRYLIALPESPNDRDHQVRLMFGNGLRPEIWQTFKKRFGITRVHEFYGSSEGNVGFMNALNIDNTVGFTPVPYAIVAYDIDADEPIRFADGFMRKVKKGHEGLLLGAINDASPFDGYTDAAKTEKTILRNVFEQGDAWFNTGDLMRDLGYRHAQFVDRLGDTFRWKGENVSTTEVENIIGQLGEVLDVAVYGVEIPNTNGRAGMAAVRLKEGENLNLEDLYRLLSSCLPDYAIPHFLRVVDRIETTGTHKYKKAPLKQQAYDPALCGKELYVRLPDEPCFKRLSDELFQEIQSSKFRF